MALLFEAETCSRCGGSGEYSFHAMYGKRCFKCMGAKEVLTKRGKVAQNYFTSLCKVRAGDVKVGDLLKVTDFTNGGSMFDYYAKVAEITTNPPGSQRSMLPDGTWKDLDSITIRTEHPKYGRNGVTCSVDTMLDVRTPDHKEKIQKALAYQETLTKMGKPRKRTTKESAAE